MKCRWVIAAGAVGIHISLGSVYAWSVFKKPFMDAFGWNEFEAGLPFGLAIFVLGMSAAVMGHVVERRGPRFSGFLATGLWGGGLMGAGIATSGMISSDTLRLVCYCFFAWALAGLVGSFISSLLRQSAGSYEAMMQVFVWGLVLALLVSVATKMYLVRQLRSDARR